MTKTWPSIFLLILLSSFVLSTGCSEDPAHIYIGKQGADPADGTREAPFKLFSQALDHARSLKAEQSKKEIILHVLPGEYQLEESLLIGPKLSGLKIIGEDAGLVTLSGAKKLNLQWKQDSTGIYSAALAEDRQFDQFIVNGSPQILARYPNFDENGGDWQGHAADALSPERVQSWKNPKGGFFHAMHRGRWGGFHYEITGVSEEGEVEWTGGFQNNRPSAPHEKFRMVENIFEELDSPGEWFYDQEAGMLYFWPQEGMELDHSTFEIARLDDLIQIVGTEENPVRNIEVEGITFKYTRRTFMKEYEQLLRSDWSIYRGAALFVEGAEHCRITACEFTDLGGNVIMVSGYNRNITISKNHIHDSGASAISFVGKASAVRSPSFTYTEYVPLSEMDTVSGPQTNEYPKNCLADNNLIYRIGRLEKQAAGVQIAMAMDITVSHNSIYDVPRAGINIGDGTWGGHVISYNDVFNTVMETGDHGSFNSWGRDRFWHPNRGVMDSLTTARRSMVAWDAIRTTTINNNRFRCDHGWDIDLDDGSSNYHIYNNLCLNGGIKLREGFDRLVENNIMINNGFHPHVWFANSEDVFKNNIVMTTHQDVRLKGWGKEVDQNFFTNEEALIVTQAKGVDASSSYFEAEFADPKSLNYTLPADSEPIKQGFNNFPMNEFGVQLPALKKIAKTPEVPAIEAGMQGGIQASNTILWKGMKLKSIETMAEQSASGLREIAGVLVMKVMDRQAQSLQLKENDVILKVADHKINTIEDLQALDWKAIESSKGEITVMRNQVETTLKLK
ncbi:peptide-binding protein [Echinicola pacifica]|uniref:Peptide-binding protein n=1 Tax=Echinicola pacifica TaxID=346377 RepID=A0A918PL76_9BACT|nr:right-handed parallel beta-helix repeat-containing protein [Echinicola pacifica]GGZ13491.1 peptide-binding protein [Echinicola pacifica]